MSKVCITIALLGGAHAFTLRGLYNAAEEMASTLQSASEEMASALQTASEEVAAEKVPDEKVTSTLLSGLIQATDTSEFLTCDTSNCWFTSNADDALTFARETGNDGQYKYVVQGGSYDGWCLDREHCHSSTSNARVSGCDHCGSYHWGMSEDGKLAEDNMANCIQNDGSVAHCSDHFQAVGFYQPDAPWNPPQGAWQLAATSVAAALSQQVSWGISSSETDATTSTWAQELEASFEEGVIFEDVEMSYKISTSIATTMSSTFTQQLDTTCKADCAQNVDKPFTFLYQWYTESSRSGIEAQTTRATSCNYMCLYNTVGTPPEPKCSLFCCYDVDCQTCNPECAA